jgi:hypothetical protein
MLQNVNGHRFAEAAVGTLLATSALAQNATNARQIEHHVAKIDGTRFDYVTTGIGALWPGCFGNLPRQHRPSGRHSSTTWPSPLFALDPRRSSRSTSSRPRSAADSCLTH